MTSEEGRHVHGLQGGARGGGGDGERGGTMTCKEEGGSRGGGTAGGTLVCEKQEKGGRRGGVTEGRGGEG